MIVRIWKGKTLKNNGDNFFEYLKSACLNNYKNAKGNKGFSVLKNSSEKESEFILISLWESYNAIINFTNGDIENSVCSPDINKYLIEDGEKVSHYNLLFNSPFKNKIDDIPLFIKGIMI